ncbi:MAG: OmpA family protein, partial [Myxococcota bacterium]|nr:OmpA family protein [Myxococcota bacterium]
ALQSMQAAFSSGGMHRTEHVFAKESKNNDYRESSRQGMNSMVSDLRDVVARQKAEHMIKMTQKKTEVRMTIGDNILFESGSANVKPEFFGVLRDIVEVLHDRPVRIIVEGHADSDGTTEAKNWELSSQRAVAVVNLFRSFRDTEQSGLPYIDGQQIEAHARGEFWPADPIEGAAPLNRRVEIVIRGKTLSSLDAVKEVEFITGGSRGR